jgi:CRISPR-associated protein Cas1
MRRTTSVSAPVAHLVGPGRLKVVNGHLAFAAPGQPPLRLDPMALRSLICYGDVSVSGSAVDLLLRHGVQTAWMTPAGQRCRGRLERSDPPTTRTRLRQHLAFASLAVRLVWARRVVLGKVAAQSAAARHYQRHGQATAGPVLVQLDAAGRAAAVAATLDELRGVEGSASVAWFRLLGELLRPPWQFPQRTRRPPTDPVNALLSLGYTWLLTRAVGRAEAAGYEVYLGGLHDYRAGRPSLACDLIEPLRVPAVDRWVLAVLNGGVRRPDDFCPDGGGGIRLQPGVFGDTLRSWETHWVEQRQEEVLEAWLEQLAEVLRRSIPPDLEPASDDAL